MINYLLDCICGHQRKIAYFGPADMVGHVAGVQNSIRVPYRMFTWLKKSTAAITEARQVNALQAGVPSTLELKHWTKEQSAVQLQHSATAIETLPSKACSYYTSLNVKKHKQGSKSKHGRLTNETQDGGLITVDSKPLVEVLPDRQTDRLSKVTTAKGGIDVPFQLHPLHIRGQNSCKIFSFVRIENDGE